VRNLLTIFRYELLMQVKSLRFKGTCFLAGLFAFGLYQSGVYQQELRPSQTFLDFEALPFYLLAVVFTGLYPMGRIRKTGMHSILMTRPFSTFILALGQMLAALVTLLFPMMIFFFIPGLLLRWQFEMDFPFAILFYVLLFYFIPGICCVLSVSIWIRTCFKNNIMALIILGIIFAGMILLANSPMLNTNGPYGRIHNFVPMVSLFSQAYWRRIRDIEYLSFSQLTNLKDWFNFLLSAVYSCMFLLLTCYHLRRTEPQRKVLGTYGRHWYHTPTFLKIACDLKIDPHVRFKSHAILFLLAATIFLKTGWPMIQPKWRNFWAYREMKASSENPIPKREDLEKRFDAKKFSEECLVKVNVIQEDMVYNNDKLTSQFTFTHDRNASETLAVVLPWGRWDFKIDKIIMEERKIPFIEYGGNYFIEAKEFESLEEGKEHVVTIQAALNKSAMGDVLNYNLGTLFTRGFQFARKKRTWRDGMDNESSSFWMDKRNLWPVHITLTVPAILRLADSPVPTHKVEKEPEKEKWKFWEKGPTVTYYFDIPAMRNGYRSSISFLNRNEELVDLDSLGYPVRFVVEKRKARILKEILEGAVPLIEEFCGLYKISFSEPLILWTNRGGQIQTAVYEIQRIQTRLNRGTWWKDQLFEKLDQFQKELLEKLFYQTLSGRGPNYISDFWDLAGFIAPNINKGLNNKIFGTGQFESFSFSPVNRHLDAKRARELENVTRKKMLEEGEVPIFQMLYHVMGHEAWINMLADLRKRAENELLSPELLQESAQKVYDKPLDWFFDYWTKEEKGLPVYRVDYARARMITSEDEEETIYEIDAQFTNEGTGRMPVPVWVGTSKGTVTGDVWIGSGETVTWNITTKGLPVNVMLDPQGWIIMAPAWDEKFKDWIVKTSIPVEILKTEKKIM
jgi:hypothetical protein